MQNKQLIKNNRKVRAMTKTVYKWIVYKEGKLLIAESKEELEVFLYKEYDIYEMLEINTTIKRVEL